MTNIHEQSSLSAAEGNDDAYKVMLVDDSAVIVGALRRILDKDPQISVVTSAMNGEAALRQLDSHPEVEVVVLDIEMPIMDGLSALPLLLEKKPDLKVIVSSTLTKRNAEISLEALRKGAADYLTKPSSASELNGGTGFREQLIEKIKAFAGQVRSLNDVPLPKCIDNKPPVLPAEQSDVELKTMPLAFSPDVLAIGSSTGGPQALFSVMPHLKNLSVPILITQHMPPTFTTILADHITKQTGVPCVEPKDGDIVEAGKAYLAPGDFHLGLLKDDQGVLRISLNDGPAVNYCRPAVDFMLEEISKQYKPQKIMTVILTGMGRDGCKASKALSEKGGVVFAQDKASSIVWGMPGAVAIEGICHAVESLGNIGPLIRKYIR